jgi:hypothetical protein
MKKFLSILQLVGPSIISAVVPGGPVIAQLVTDAIGKAQQIPGATGSEKKSFALQVITDGALSVNAGTGKPVLDNAALVNAASQGIDAVVSAVKLVQATHDAIHGADAPVTVPGVAPVAAP